MEDNQEIAIKVDGVSKGFKLPHEKVTSIKGAVLNFYKKRGYEKQQVLKDISFEVKKGEFFGIVGRNGSGKSTLLKLLAGIYSVDRGNINVNGKLTPFIELGVGFNMDLTGRENVYLNGSLLGFTRKEMSQMYHDIVEFAELEKFMDQKLKNYSSGMQVRLAFSIAIRAQSDILLIDEVLAVGDAAFQQKCFEVFAELKKMGTTIVLVTHDMGSVLRFCDRAILIDSGKIIDVGKPTLVADHYLELNYDAGEKHRKKDSEEKNKEDKNKPRFGTVVLKGEDGKEKTAFDPGDVIRINTTFTNSQELPLRFGFQIFNEQGVYCFGTNTLIDKQSVTSKKKGKLTITFDAKLTPGNYSITLATMNDSATTVYNYMSRIAEFRITKSTQLDGVALLDHRWLIN